MQKTWSLLLSFVFVFSFVPGAATQSNDDQLVEIITNQETYSQTFMNPEQPEGTPSSIADMFPAVTTLLVITDSESTATELYGMFVDVSTGPDYEIEDLDNLGDEAIRVHPLGESEIENGIVVARKGEVVIISMASPVVDGEVALLVVKHILETGPSGDPIDIDESGIATGGWADAFPQPEDIAGLEKFEAAAVYEFSFPEPATPITIATPAT